MLSRRRAEIDAPVGVNVGGDDGQDLARQTKDAQPGRARQPDLDLPTARSADHGRGVRDAVAVKIGTDIPRGGEVGGRRRGRARYRAEDHQEAGGHL